MHWTAGAQAHHSNSTALPSHRRGLPKCRHRQPARLPINTLGTVLSCLAYLIHIGFLFLPLTMQSSLHTFFTLPLSFFLHFLIIFWINQSFWNGAEFRPRPRFLVLVAAMEMITPTLGASVLGDTSSLHIPYTGSPPGRDEARGLSSETIEPTLSCSFLFLIIAGRSMSCLSIYTIRGIRGKFKQLS